MNNWRDLFQDHILARGEMYFYDGAVQELHKTEHGYQAIVEGTEDYEVEIEIEEGEVCEMYCSCPYAEDGSHCKHMAAVLYVFCQVLFPKKSVGIPFFQQGIFPAFSGHYASLRMRACSIR